MLHNHIYSDIYKNIKLSHESLIYILYIDASTKNQPKKPKTQQKALEKGIWKSIKVILICNNLTSIVLMFA